MTEVEGSGLGILYLPRLDSWVVTPQPLRKSTVGPKSISRQTLLARVLSLELDLASSRFLITYLPLAHTKQKFITVGTSPRSNNKADGVSLFLKSSPSMHRPHNLVTYVSVIDLKRYPTRPFAFQNHGRESTQTQTSDFHQWEGRLRLTRCLHSRGQASKIISNLTSKPPKKNPKKKPRKLDWLTRVMQSAGEHAWVELRIWLAGWSSPVSGVLQTHALASSESYCIYLYSTILTPLLGELPSPDLTIYCESLPMRDRMRQKGILWRGRKDFVKVTLGSEAWVSNIYRIKTIDRALEMMRD